MFNDFRPLWAEINQDNLAHNIKGIKKNLGRDTEYIGVVKADGYGHGAIEIAHELIENGVNYLAVAMVDEAIELRNSGIESPVLILGYTPERNAETVVDYHLSQTCYSFGLAKALSDAAVKLESSASIQIAVDTGMGRIGFQPDEASADVIEKIAALPNVSIDGIFTHFSVADEQDKEYTKWQYTRFMSFLSLLKSRGIEIKLRHAGNSAAVIDLPDMHLNGVRPGIIQYGLYPSENVNKLSIDLKPVMSLKANIIHIKEVNEGTSISYGRRFITRRKSKIATLPVGYADGYSRLLFGKAKVIVNGRYAPVVGTICMDQCMIDVTDAGDVKVGDDCILMGSDGTLSITAEEIASWLGTINYEVVCMFSKRIPRVYIKNGSIIKVRNYLL